MSEIYKLRTPDGYALSVDKNTNKILFKHKDQSIRGKYTERCSKALFEADEILRNTPYKDYKPKILDPKLHTGQSSTLLEFKEIQELYYKELPKGGVAPWTKKEKAYYESLKTKRERYKYLVIRSGLRSTVIDIPFDAIACAEDKEKFEKYKELFDEVERNRGNTHLSKGYLPIAEWELAAGILGDIRGFGLAPLANTGFKARAVQCDWLYFQLGGKLHNFPASYSSMALAWGIAPNPSKEQMIKAFIKNPPYDKFGMLPYLDEMVGVDWIIDCNKHLFSYDPYAWAIGGVCGMIEEGKLKDPRDPSSTPEDRERFNDKFWSYINGSGPGFAANLRNDRTEAEVDRHIYSLKISAKIAALTPPQGYPNAPRYLIPELLRRLYDKGEFDMRVFDVRIPAIRREHFPEWLLAKIEEYAKKHNIKD